MKAVVFNYMSEFIIFYYRSGALLTEYEFNMIENTTKLSSNVKKIIYDENLDIRKEERKKAKENGLKPYE